MARIRSIKPEFFTSEQVVSVSIAARYLFEGIWVFGDDEGLIKNAPMSLKMRIFPADNVDVGPLIEELLAEGLVVEVGSDQGRLLWTPTFKDHQSPKRPTATKFTGIGSPFVPNHTPIECMQFPNEYPTSGEHVGNMRGTATPGEEGRGEERRGGEAATPPTPTCGKHSNWDHKDPCGACMRDRRAQEAYEAGQAKAAAAARREAQRNPACPHGFPRHEKCERCGDSWPG